MPRPRTCGPSLRRRRSGRSPGRSPPRKPGLLHCAYLFAGRLVAPFSLSVRACSALPFAAPSLGRSDEGLEEVMRKMRESGMGNFEVRLPVWGHGPTAEPRWAPRSRVALPFPSARF